MKKSARSSLSVFALIALSSCALPPREAWRVVQRDGLLPYIAVEMGRRPVPPYVHLPAVRDSRFVTVTTSAKAPAAVRPGVYVARAPVAPPATRYLATGPAAPAREPVAPKAVPPKPAPPPVVASKPKPVAPKPAVKSAPKPAPQPPAVAAVPKPRQPQSVPPAPARPSADELAGVPRAKPAPPEPSPAAARPEKPAVGTDASASAGKPAPAAVDAQAGELPFGFPIAGRPGLVNSPFAGKYQLVDVTGLSPGQEVKCPYTGKLFRVPGQQQARNDAKPLAEPPPPPARKAGGDKKP